MPSSRHLGLTEARHARSGYSCLPVCLAAGRGPRGRATPKALRCHAEEWSQAEIQPLRARAGLPGREEQVAPVLLGGVALRRHFHKHSLHFTDHTHNYYYYYYQ